MASVVRAEAVITAQNRLRPGLQSAAAELERFRRLQERATAAAGAERTIQRAGQLARAGLGGLAAGLTFQGAAGAARPALELERSMANVERATDASGRELQAYEQQVLDLARSTGKTKEELAQMLAAAGFAGRPKNELPRFMEYAAKATVAWGTGAEETGQSLAELGNIYQANQRRIEEIGDTINAVADSSASKETDLLEILRRVGGQGRMLGISAERMVAFGAALREVGVQSEVAATGLNAMMTKIAVPDDKFDASLKTMGVNVKRFRQSVDKDATGAILTLLEALQKVEGSKRMSILKDMFGMEYADDIGRLTNALPRLNELLKIAQDRTRSLGSVRAGFAQQSQKDFNRIDRAQQSMDVLMVRLGKGLKEIGGAGAESINQAVDAIEKGETRIQRIVSYLRARAGAPPQDKEPDFEDTINPPGLDPIRNWIDGVTGKNAEQARRFGEVDRRTASENAALDSARHNQDLARRVNESTSPFPRVNGFAQSRERVNAAAEHSGEVARRIHQRRAAESNEVAAAQARAEPAARQMRNLGQFGSLPVTTGVGRDGKSLGKDRLKLEPDFGEAIAKAGEVRTVVDGLGPAGQQAGGAMASGFAAGLARMESEADAAVARIKQKIMSLDGLRPNVRVNVSTGDPGGFNTGKSMPEAR